MTPKGEGSGNAPQPCRRRAIYAQKAEKPMPPVVFDVVAPQPEPEPPAPKRKKGKR